MQSRLTQQFALTLKGQKLGGQLSRGALQAKHQLIQGSPGPDSPQQLAAHEARIIRPQRTITQAPQEILGMNQSCRSIPKQCIAAPTGPTAGITRDDP